MQKQLVLWSERSFKPSRTEILFRVKDSYFYYFHSSPIPPYRPALKLWRPKQSKTNPNVEQSILSCMRLNWIDCEFYIYYTLKDRWSLMSFKVDSSAPSAINIKYCENVDHYRRHFRIRNRIRQVHSITWLLTLPP